MADEKNAEEKSHKNPIIFEEHELDLSLGLRPLVPSSTRHQNTVIESNPNVNTVSKRENQAIRRREAKLKRDLKRKCGSIGQNGVVIQDEVSERCRKAINVGVQSTVISGDNAGCFRGYNDNFGGMNGKGENRSSISSGSSSGVSDNYHSNSAAGGHSSDTGSHSSQPHQHLPAAAVPTSLSEPKQSTSSQQLETPYCSNHEIPQTQLYSCSSKSPELVTPSNISINIIPQNQTETQSKDKKEAVTGRPPKPNGHLSSQETRQIPQVPCVKTTGNGPKGKTITGFLYKYTKAEVNIVCVCHGASFSPSGFVEHAGGVDVEHPLRHIRVAPFPLS